MEQARSSAASSRRQSCATGVSVSGAPRSSSVIAAPASGAAAARPARERFRCTQVSGQVSINQTDFAYCGSATRPQPECDQRKICAEVGLPTPYEPHLVRAAAREARAHAARPARRRRGGSAARAPAAASAGPAAPAPPARARRARRGAGCAAAAPAPAPPAGAGGAQGPPRHWRRRLPKCGAGSARVTEAATWSN